MADAKGRPTRARDKLRNNFLHALAEDFTAHGKAAIESMRKTDPSGYIRAIASLMPKEMDVKHHTPLDHLTDDQLEAVVDATERFLSERAGEEPAAVAGSAEQVEGVSPLH